MKRLAFVLLSLMAVPALADPDPDDTTEQPKKTKKKKKKKKKDKKADEKKAEEKKKDEIEMDDPTAVPPPVSKGGGVDGATTIETPIDPNAAATAPVVAQVVVGATPVEMTKRPLVLQTGRLDVGGYLAIPRGPDYTSTTAGAPIGKWIGFVLRAEYGAVDKLSVGLDVDLAPVTSDAVSTDNAPSKLGGFVANAKYALIDGQRTAEKEPLQLAAHLSLGMLKRGAPALGPFSFPLYGPDLQPAVGVGVAIQKTFLDQKAAIILDPHLFVQAGGHQTASASGMTTGELLITLELPVYFTYQAAPNLSIGARTGVYTGQKFSFSPSDNLAIPIVAEGVFTTLKNQLDVGVDLGLANLTARGSIPEGFLLGLFATYRTK